MQSGFERLAAMARGVIAFGLDTLDPTVMRDRNDEEVSMNR